MKRTLKLLSTAVLLGSLLMIYSCSEEFLTKEPPGAASTSFLQSSEGVEALLIATYERMQGSGIFGGAMGTDWTYASGASDDAYKGTSSGDQAPFNNVERYEVLTNNQYMRERWRDCYDGVARANVALEMLWTTQKGATPITDATRAKQIEAELKFLRAWFHFQANKIFEKIPYILTQTELGDTKPEEVKNDSPGWTGIEADLQFALANLPVTHPRGEVGRPNKYAVEAVLAHCFMYEKKLSSAKPLLDDIIANGGYSLVSNFYDNYDCTHENNKESIFEIQCSVTGTSQSGMLIDGATWHQNGPASCGGWGFFQASECLFEAFQVTPDGLPVLDIAAREPLANDMGKGSGDVFVPTDHLLDLRVDWTIARRGIDFLGWGIHPGNAWIREQANGGPYMCKKYMHKKEEQSLCTNGSGFNNPKNYRMYRLANILLWRAEIAVEDGQLDVAMGLVNQVRNRAKGSTPVMGLCTTYTLATGTPVVAYDKPAANYKVEPYPVGSPVFATQATARQAVQMETRLEFAMECHRFFDLRRWGLLGTVIPDYITRDQKFRTFLTGAVFSATKNDYWPIPQDQVDLQKGVITQDPAY
jgi:starch-binding outer membrane protein, SusD/RagB family